uniref:Integrase catalytic domain-containing protein n=1 Tax=Photinus pyralis TaxID=7054 RepID=A0A1Y1KVF7_PHOPY
MHTLHIDHLGPFVTSRKKNQYLITGIDGFTKFAFLKAVRNTSVNPVITFLNDIFNMFGVVLRIVCDRGSAFTSKRFDEYCKSMGIKVQCNGDSTSQRPSGEV